MTTLESVNVRPAGHTYESSISADDAQCPYCGQSISRKEYREIQTRIADEERARIADVEKALQERFAREREQAEGKKVAEIEKAKRDAARAAEQQVKALRAPWRRRSPSAWPRSAKRPRRGWARRSLPSAPAHMASG
jgi:hypothetical protein